jgi:trans-aconitate methyltransferase
MDIKELKVEGKQNHPWEYARSKVVNDLIDHYLTGVMAAKNAVDIGCGDVFFLTRFSDRHPDFNLSAVDTAFDDGIIGELSAKYSQYSIKFYMVAAYRRKCCVPTFQASRFVGLFNL